MLVHKIIKGSTLRLGYAVIIGSVNDLSIFKTRLRKRSATGLSTTEIPLPSELRAAAGNMPAGFNIVFTQQMISSLAVGEYQLDMVLSVPGGDLEPAPPILIVIKE